VIRAVIDTNVLVSALISPSGNAALVVLAVQQGMVRPSFSEAILQEYTAVLARPRFAFASAEIAALLDMFRAKGDFFRPDKSVARSPDPADTKFLQCADAAQADFIVTGNKRHFPGAPYGPTHVVNATQLLERITLEMRP
jgi:putative PIN family toxin of toxin-antitoxin system